MKKPIAVLQYLLSIHILALLILAIIRTILYIANINQTEGVGSKTTLFTKAMLKGLWSDNTMSCYIIALPLLVLLIFALYNKIPKVLIKVFNIYFIILYSILFGFSIADIPYFIYNFTHIGASIFNWLGYGTDTAGMILQEKSYYIYFFIYVITITAFSFAAIHLAGKLLKKEYAPINNKEYCYYIPAILIVWALCLLGIRGTVGQLPLRVGDAYFCNNSFFNQLGVNPAFFFIKSTSGYFKKHNSLEKMMDTQEAIANARKYLGIEGSDNKSPLYRFVETEGEPKNMNVVVVLMESFSSEFLKWEFNGENLTPYIHELIGKSYYFDNFYSAGIHTNNGIASTLYSYPPQFNKSMMGINTNHYYGLPNQLRDYGYETLFFITGNPTYDNMNSFLYENGFDKIYSQNDYPGSKVVNNFGVQDDYLFEFGIDKLNKVSENGKTFLATFLTVSNHPPFVVPEKFKNKGEKDDQRMIAFIDSSIKEFMENAEKQEWYSNTIFVFLGDHGRALGQHISEMPLSYNHIPLIIYSRAFTDSPRIFNQPGGQVDVFPTIMGLLNKPYTNNTLGTDLLGNNIRPCMYFVSDNHLGCINNNYFYSYNLETKNEELFAYHDNKSPNIISEHTREKDSLKTYAMSMMITGEYMTKNKLTQIAEHR